MMHPRWPLLVAVCAVSLAADQTTKMIALRWLSPGHPMPVAGRWVYLTLERNPGGSFGLLPQATVYFIAASAVIAVALLLYARTAVAHSALLTVAIAMLLGGAVGNLIDRVRFGHVTDFIDLRVWPIFNVADIAVTLGVALIVLAVLLPSLDSARGGPEPACPELAERVEGPHPREEA
jgi:signal peptidase II